MMKINRSTEANLNNNYNLFTEADNNKNMNSISGISDIILLNKNMIDDDRKLCNNISKV